MSTVGNPAPDFKLDGYFNGDFGQWALSELRGKWVVLLFYPLDFTFVCPTEVLAFSAATEQFKRLNAQVLGLSVDSKFAHKAWVETARAEGGLGGQLGYPLLADLNKTAARDYGVLIPEAGVALRGLFLINPEGVVVHSVVNSLSVGRSVNEALRVLKAFHHLEQHAGEVCPANWDEGGETMVANPDGMRQYLKRLEA
jgi:peroxiredoxin (alkyl hydroperoxide reductase subunit C)